MKSKIKITVSAIISIFFFGLILSSCSGGSSKKTSFSSIKEAKDYVHYKNYKTLVKHWGEPSSVSEPYIYGSGAESVVVEVTWNNIKVENEPMEIRFENAESAYVKDDGSFEKWPTKPIMVYLDGTGYGW
ncbi:hypothetical protein MWU76_05770 [Gelidibacter sp. F2691]|nr:hypothetical protein [Gelidibacter sp. F2691]